MVLKINLNQRKILTMKASSNDSFQQNFLRDSFISNFSDSPEQQDQENGMGNENKISTLVKEVAMREQMKYQKYSLEEPVKILNN